MTPKQVRLKNTNTKTFEFFVYVPDAVPLFRSYAETKMPL